MPKRKPKPKKRASTPRPYNAWTMSESELRSAILAKLRMLTRWWKPKALALKSEKCKACGKKFPKKELKGDHIMPIVPVDGWKKTDDLFLWYNWNEWLRNTFVEASAYQAMCKPCHDIKSKEENLKRKEFKEKWKK